MGKLLYTLCVALVAEPVTRLGYLLMPYAAVSEISFIEVFRSFIVPVIAAIVPIVVKPEVRYAKPYFVVWVCLVLYMVYGYLTAVSGFAKIISELHGVRIERFILWVLYEFATRFVLWSFIVVAYAKLVFGREGAPVRV